ncbi:hypothetical protein PGT21_020642 [Puccinia graminis f. sp. tritici]|uniref:Uncharacterized protein n=1 Tax=Puccinia graminis f. sp. tritici TaxID=56615 RepID=A0A5B0PY32_PUCGR|nr:hypothetical protein PGT21_020642 [Puccinia graminis f. sp. tritici]KAA1135103.1 hypothetical protein PGTUg99_010214 [Puccinia graminis f. sp. tritici]
MKYSARAMIWAVLFCGEINQQKVAAVDTSRCIYCAGTRLSLGKPRQKTCKRDTLCKTYHRLHKPCQKIVWKTQVKCLDPKCSKIEDFFECEDDENFHTFEVCPTNGKH